MLLRTVLGLLPAVSGSVTVLGHDVTGWPTNRIVELGVRYAPQPQAFFSDLTVDENLRLGSLNMSEIEYRLQRDRVIQYFPLVGERLKQKVGSLGANSV